MCPRSLTDFYAYVRNALSDRNWLQVADEFVRHSRGLRVIAPSSRATDLGLLLRRSQLDGVKVCSR